jgi:lecithin-cholesterol acyltransferase
MALWVQAGSSGSILFQDGLSRKFLANLFLVSQKSNSPRLKIQMRHSSLIASSMLLSAFAVISFSKKPVFIVPGLMASPLSGHATTGAYWYCPRDYTGLFWVDYLLMLPPELNCIFDWMRITWNETINDVDELGYIHLETGPMGDVDSVTSVDSLFGMHILPTYEYVVDSFLKLGWTKNVDLLGVPNDWRFGLHYKKAFWDSFTQLIEKSVNEQGAKAVLVGHSMGGKLVHHYLTNLTTPEWRSKYIESAILLAPSIAGSGVAFGSLWTGYLPFVDFLGAYPETVRGSGGAHVHLPNIGIFGDTTIYIDETGQEHKGTEVVNLLKNNGKMPGDSAKILDLFTPFFATAPAPIDVPTALLYNSGLPTTIALDRRTGQDEFIVGRGDILVNAEGPEYCCTKWKGPAAIDCVDLHSDDIGSDHFTMLLNPDVIEFVVSRAVNTTWIK